MPILCKPANNKEKIRALYEIDKNKLVLTSSETDTIRHIEIPEIIEIDRINKDSELNGLIKVSFEVIRKYCKRINRCVVIVATHAP